MVCYGFILILSTIVSRYMLLRNHFDIHVFFVERYLFVFAGTVYFFLLWLIISSRRFFSQTTGKSSDISKNHQWHLIIRTKKPYTFKSEA
jgi:hypothetical protein